MILKTLDYMSKALVNIIYGQILAIGVNKFAFEVLTSSKSFSE
jgi:hypothetical protein